MVPIRDSAILVYEVDAVVQAIKQLLMKRSRELGGVRHRLQRMASLLVCPKEPQQFRNLYPARAFSMGLVLSQRRQVQRNSGLSGQATWPHFGHICSLLRFLIMGLKP